MNLQKHIVLPAPSETYSVSGDGPEKDFKIADLLGLLLRRKRIVIVTPILFLSVAILYCVFTTPRYQATAQVQFQKESSGGDGLDSVGTQEDNSSIDAMEEAISIQTQANVLQSDTLALTVIKDLSLENNSDFVPKFNPLGWLLSYVTPTGPSDPSNAALEDSPRKRERLFAIFQKRLKVKPVAGTRLIDISFRNPNPRIAAEVVNNTTQGLSDYNFKTKHDATAKTATWLATQLAELRSQSEQLQEKVARSQRDSGVLTLGGVDAQGREQLYSTVLDKLQQATTAYTQAQSNRISREAIYRVVQSGNAEAILGLTVQLCPLDQMRWTVYLRCFKTFDCSKRTSKEK